PTEKPKGPVAADRAGYDRSELIAAQFVLFLRRGEKESPGVKRVVTKELEQSAMDLVGPGLNCKIYLRARVHSILGGVDGALHLKFFQSLDRRNVQHGAMQRIDGDDPVHGDVLIGVALAVRGYSDHLAGRR